jgi:hypothetical protein
MREAASFASITRGCSNWSSCIVRVRRFTTRCGQSGGRGEGGELVVGTAWGVCGRVLVLEGLGWSVCEGVEVGDGLVV